MAAHTVPGPTRPRGSALWLLPAFVLLLLSQGRAIVPAAAWLAPVVMLRFVRARGAWTGIVAGLFATWLAFVIGWRGMIPVRGGLYLLIALLFALVQFGPFAIDRVTSRRLGPLGWLVLPFAAVTMELLSARLNPYGSWGAVAYTQAQNLPLIQMVSVTGLGGIAFLIAWFAVTVNGAWESGFSWQRCREQVLAFAAAITVILLLGGVRLLSKPGDATRIASFSVIPPRSLSMGDLLFRHRTKAGEDSLKAPLRVLQDSLLVAADREAMAGALIVFWSECNGLVLKTDEEAFIARGEALARARGIYLGMALAVFTPGEGFYENELVLCCPEGKTLARYHKSRPVPSDPERGADRHLAVAETAYGRAALAICFDADFPDQMRDVGRGRAGLLLLPSSDWKAIDPIHTRMALFRGIENGCSVVRQTAKGLSAATDAYGRVLASADYFYTGPITMVAQVPTRRVKTIYRRIGDLFSWACIGGLGFVTLAAVASRRT